MAFHVPFNQRHPNPYQRPVYIGFDVPAPRQRRKFNWWGFNGMWMSFASLLTAGFLSPVPLLISLMGLRRPGRKMATVGALTSLGGIGLATTLVLGSMTAQRQHAHARQRAHQNRHVQQQIAETESLLAAATGELVEYRDQNSGLLPNEIDANMLVIKHVDPWGESLRFDAERDHAIVRSAGPDRSFDSGDDVTSSIEGETDREPLLSLGPATE